MAHVATKLTVKFAWWVKPYLGRLYLVILAIAPFIDEGDETINGLIEVHSNFICRFGVRCLAE